MLLVLFGRVRVAIVGRLRHLICFIVVKTLGHRIEQVVVIVALLDHPNDYEDDDVQKVFLNEETSDLGRDSRSVQSSVTVDCRVNSHDDVQTEGHGKNQVGLVLHCSVAHRLQLRVVDAIIWVLSGVVLPGVKAENDHDKKEARCDTEQVVPLHPSLGWAERIVNGQDQVHTEAQVKHE